MLEGSHRFSARGAGDDKTPVSVASGSSGDPMLRVASSFISSRASSRASGSPPRYFAIITASPGGHKRPEARRPLVNTSILMSIHLPVSKSTRNQFKKAFRAAYLTLNGERGRILSRRDSHHTKTSRGGD